MPSKAESSTKVSRVIKRPAATKKAALPPPGSGDEEEATTENFSTVLLATKKVMEQLSAVYPELGRPGVTIPAAKPDGSIKREARPMDFDQIRDNYSAPVGERDIRDAANEGPNPADNGMLSWLGFGSDANRGLVSSDAIGERDLLSLLEGITSVTTRAASAGEMPSRHMRESAPAGGASGVIEEEGESSEESGEEEEEEAEKPKLQDFVVECGLGTGGFAAVVLVEHSKTGRIYACKTILKSRITREKQIQRIGTERRVLMHNSDHPFIATMYYAFQNHRQLFFVLDFCAGGDLYYHLTRMKNSRFKHFSEEATQFYLAELVLALEHLHNQGIVYRDLKLENVMLDEEGHVKLVDFGLSKEGVEVPCEEPLSPCGSILYMAPELLEMTGGTSVDWWTMGILMHEMLTGRSPWKSETQNAVLAELRGKSNVKLSKELSPRGNAIISGFVTRNPRKRLGHRGATEIKSHPFFWPRLKQSSDWIKLYNRGFQPPIRPCKTKIKPPSAADRGAGVRESGEQADSLSPKQGGTKKEAKEREDAREREKAAFQKQYGTQNFEKSQRNSAIKAVAFPDPSNDGSVGYEFEGFTVAEGGPDACLRIKDSDMVEIKRLVAKHG